MPTRRYRPAPTRLRDLRRVAKFSELSARLADYNNRAERWLPDFRDAWADEAQSRLASAGLVYADHPIRQLGAEAYRLQHIALHALRRDLDRLIARHGANTLVSDLVAQAQAESRPKDTAEVAPQSANPQDDSDKHGGDGASGEVEDPQGQPAKGGGEGDEGEPAKGKGQGDEGEGGEGDEGQGGGEGGGEGQGDAASQPDSRGVGFGGIHADLATCRAEVARRGRKHPDRARQVEVLTRLIRRALKRIDQGQLGTPSPRLDGRKLVRELASRRVSLSRCQRTDQEPSLLIVAADVSGSCNASALETTTAGLEIALRDARVVVVTHSNGLVVDVWSQTAVPKVTDPGAWWDDLLKQHTVAGMVAFGDGDARPVYEHIAERADVLWLDNYAARRGVRAKGRPFGRCTYFDGVSDVSSAIDALLMAERAA